MTSSPSASDRAKPLLSADFIRQMEHLDVQARHLFAGKLPGERRSKRRGQSVEYADFRPYTAGDDLRFIDWNLFARLDRLILRLFLEEQDVAVNLVLDVSPSMDFGEPNKFDYARRLTAALGYLSLVHLNRVSVEIACGDPSRQRLGRAMAGAAVSESAVGNLMGMRDMRGRRPAAAFLRFLEELRPGRAGRLAESLRALAADPRRRGIVIVISDLLDPDPQATIDQTLRFLGDPRFESYMIHLLSPQELDPASAEELQGDLELVDSESGRGVPVTINPKALSRYRERLAHFQNEVITTCRRRKIGLVSVSTATPIEQLVLQDLQRIGLLG